METQRPSCVGDHRHTGLTATQRTSGSSMRSVPDVPTAPASPTPIRCPVCVRLVIRVPSGAMGFLAIGMVNTLGPIVMATLHPWWRPPDIHDRRHRF